MDMVLVGISDIYGFYALNRKKDKTQLPAVLNKDCAEIQFLMKKCWSTGNYQRKLINESLNTFLSLEKASTLIDNDFKDILVKKSKEYRSLLQVFISENKCRAASLEENTAVSSDLIDDLNIECQLLYKMELILGLIEIIFIEYKPRGVITNFLINWIQLHFSRHRQQLFEILNEETAFENVHYWDTMFGLMLQGQLDDARNLLSHHPHANTDAFLSIDELLRKMPTFNAYSGVSVSEFNIRWEHWQYECSARLENGEFFHYKQLQVVCKILCGDKETFKSLVDIMDTWYHYTISLVYYTNPTIRLYELPSIIDEATSICGVADNLSHLDELLVLILQDNHLAVIRDIHLVFNNLWFSTHVTDLLFHAVGNPSDNKYLSEIRESLLLDYGLELCSNSSLWQAGLIYIDYCETSLAAPTISAILERIPLTSDHKALKVIHEATQRGLDSVAMGVCRVMARKRFMQNQLGAAIWWSVKSQDAVFTSHLAHKILRKYMDNREFISSSILDHLGPAMQLSDSLTFLSKYREFHEMYQESKMKEAASLLVSLIASRLAPEYFWPMLLEDALPLLQCPQPVITVDQTYKLMYCLNAVAVNHYDSEKIREKKNKLYSSFLDKEFDFRFALTNNLARAIVQEGTVE